MYFENVNDTFIVKYFAIVVFSLRYSLDYD